MELRSHCSFIWTLSWRTMNYSKKILAPSQSLHPSIHLWQLWMGEIIMSWLAYCSSCFPRSWLLLPPFHPLKRWEEQQSLGTCLFWGSPWPNYAELISMVGHPQRHGRLKHLFFSSAITRGIMRWRGDFWLEVVNSLIQGKSHEKHFN